MMKLGPTNISGDVVARIINLARWIYLWYVKMSAQCSKWWSRKNTRRETIRYLGEKQLHGSQVEVIEEGFQSMTRLITLRSVFWAISRLSEELHGRLQWNCFFSQAQNCGPDATILFSYGSSTHIGRHARVFGDMRFCAISLSWLAGYCFPFANCSVLPSTFSNLLFQKCNRSRLQFANYISISKIIEEWPFTLHGHYFIYKVTLQFGNNS